MNLFAEAFSIIMVSAVMLTSCEKTGDNPPINELPAPIEIPLLPIEAEIVKSERQFAFELFYRVFDAESKAENRNFMISPFSLTMALNMTMNGAGTQTLAAMKGVMNMDEYEDKVINAYYKKMMENLTITDPTAKLAIANSIFTNRMVTINPDFLKTSSDYYKATVKPVDFSQSEAKEIINQWASDHTNGLIKEVIKRTNSQDLMYLLNAIYFKGIWSSKFDKNNSSKATFTTESGEAKQVDMMAQQEIFDYAEDDAMQMVSLPYGNRAFSMVLLLPREGKKQVDVVEALKDRGYWANAKSGLSLHEVELYLPKFKTEYSIELNDLLADMGMEPAFSDKADFSRMTDLSANISLVKQDTYISTDESGTEAAAVTTIGMELTSIQRPQLRKVVFNAERPFIYLIQENSTGAILFMGTVQDF